MINRLGHAVTEILEKTYAVYIYLPSGLTEQRNLATIHSSFRFIVSLIIMYVLEKTVEPFGVRAFERIEGCAWWRNLPRSAVIKKKKFMLYQSSKATITASRRKKYTLWYTWARQRTPGTHMKPCFEFCNWARMTCFDNFPIFKKKNATRSLLNLSLFFPHFLSKTFSGKSAQKSSNSNN